MGRLTIHRGTAPCTLTHFCINCIWKYKYPVQIEKYVKITERNRTEIQWAFISPEWSTCSDVFQKTTEPPNHRSTNAPISKEKMNLQYDAAEFIQAYFTSFQFCPLIYSKSTVVFFYTLCFQEDRKCPGKSTNFYIAREFCSGSRMNVTFSEVGFKKGKMTAI